jgi:hypothetical protein
MAVSDSTTVEAFWRPGRSAVVAADNNDQQNDDPDLQLSFFGTQPRIAFAGARDDQFYSDFGHDLWVARSSDDGGTWLPMINPPSDGNRSMNGPMSIASGSRGQAAVVTESNSGNSDGVQCGDPKLARSDDLVTWTTCGITPLGPPSFAADYPVVRFGGNDKLWVSFRNSDVSDDLPSGVSVWREP